MNNRPSRLLTIGAVLAAIALAGVIVYVLVGGFTTKAVSFDECVAAGFPVMESYPPQCSDGTQTFVQSAATSTVATSTVSASANVIVTSPLPDTEIGANLRVTGSARAFENTVNWRLLDEDGTELIERFATARTTDIGQHGPFESESFYPAPRGTRGTLEVFTYSANDGGIQDLVRVPVRFSAEATANLTAHFVKQDPAETRCDVTYALARRVPATAAPAGSALEALLQGPTMREAGAGYATLIPAGTRVNALSITEGVARVDFSEELLSAASGSCRVTAIRAQIENTLRQFPTVQRVEITIAGRAGALEP